jgi:chromosome segregation ATPase
MPSLADCAELTALANKVDVERKAAQTAKPLSVKAKHLEGRVAHKRRTHDEVQKRVEDARKALETAQVNFDAASSECAACANELQSLERDLAELPVEPQASKATGIELPAELAGDEEASQAIATAEAAAQAARAVLTERLRARQAETKASKSESTLGSAQPDNGADRRGGDDADMDLDDDDQRNVDDLVSEMVGQTGCSPSQAGASDEGDSVAKRAELKRRVTAVASGIVRKKLKKQCS